MASNSNQRSNSSASHQRDAGAQRSSSASSQAQGMWDPVDSEAWAASQEGLDGFDDGGDWQQSASPYEAAPSARAARVVDVDARPSASGRRSRERRAVDPRRAVYDRKIRRIITAVILIATLLVGYLVVTYSGLFAIRAVVAEPTEHISAQAICDLASIPAGSTLFSVKADEIAERVSADPWVASVKITRQLPSQLTISVTEREEAAVVMLSSGLSAWRLSSDGHWLESIELSDASATGGASASDQARFEASAAGVVFVSSVPVTVSPTVGAACTDESLLGLLEYLRGFSDEFISQIATADASSLAGLSLVLTSGVEVSVGNPDDIADKETVINLLLEQNAGLVTYINVRDPANPSWRGLDTE